MDIKPSGIRKIIDASDVGSVANEQILKYNSTTKKFDGHTLALSDVLIAGSGLLASGNTLSMSHLGLESLSDPGGDRILFWDETANAFKWLSVGSNLTITDTTIAASGGGGGSVAADDITAGDAAVTISTTVGAVNITPASGSAIVLDGTINVDAGVVTGATSITSTAFVGALTGNAATATALASGRTIGMTGDVVWTSASFTGAGNVTGAATIQANSVDGTMIAIGSDAQGDIMYYTGSDWARLGAGTNGHYLKTQGGSANPTWASVGGGTATAVTVADESTDTTCFPLFVTAATGDLGPKSGSNLAFNSSSGVLTATGFAGPITGNVTGNTSGTAATVTGAAQTNVTSLGTLTALTVDDVAVDGKVITMTGSSSDTAVITVGTNGALSIVTTDAAAAAANIQITADGTVDIDSAGVLTLDSGAAINIEPAVGSAILLDGTISIDAGVVTGATSITSTAFAGALTGNVTGNASGTALTVTQAAQTAITSLGTLTALTVDDVVVDGKVITMTGSSSDTAVITAGTNGTLSIVTTDAAAAAANIQITADGTAELAGTTVTLDSSSGITLDADGGTITFADAGVSLGTITSSGYSGTAATATALVSGRTIGMTGDVVWTSASFTGAGNVTGSATIQANSVDGTMVALGSDAQGDIMYYNGTDYVRLGAGTNGHFLKTQGGSANPAWASVGGGTATAVTIADESSDTTCFPLFVTAATGDLGPKSGTNLTFNSSTGVLAATGFSGPLTGNVTGNTSGTAATVTGAAQTNITSLGTLTALTVDDVVVDGKVITMTGSSSDTAVITVGTNGALSIVTTDAAATAANIQITADGTVDIDSAGVLTLDSGAAINIEPAVGSAILLDGTISVDAGVVTGATSITSTAFVGDITGDVTGNADTATALAAGRTIGMTGDVVWTSASFTGAGNVTGSATIQVNSVDGTMIALGSDAAGDIMYNNGTDYIRLAKGDDDEVLTLASGVPSWAAIGGGGDITAVVAGTGLSGGATSGSATLNVDAAQSGVTSLGTLTALTVDDVAVDGKVITMTGSSSDTVVFTAGTNGTLSIVTTDAAATAANIQITADGTVDIDSAGVLTLDSGAAINIEPASGSAILLDGAISIDAGVVTGATSITSTAFVGALTGNVTGNASGTAATVTGAAQTNITSLGTLTALTVDDVAINGKVITMTGDTSDTVVFTAGTHGTLSIVTTDDAAAAANIQITADGTVDIDSAGVLTLDSGAAINIEPAVGSAILLDGTISIDAGVVTGATSITSTAFVGALTGNASGTAATVTGAAQTNITSLGTLTALTVDDIAMNAKVMTMTGSTDDTAVFTVGTNGTLSIVTTDAAATAANIQITADGTVDIDSAGVLTLDSGAAINIEPASGSAILLDGTISIDAGVVTGATSITSTAFVGALTGNATGNASGTAATVTGAAQSNITSLGTLTALTVDDVAVDGKVITMTGSSSDTAVITVGTNGALSIVTTDAAATAANIQITADGTVDIDSAGVLTLDSGAAINIEPAAGSAILLDGTISIDAGVVTGATSITSTTFVGALTGNSSTATKLATARAIAVAGDVTGTANFDGSAAISITTTLASASVDFAHVQNVAANSILGRNANSSGVLSEIALTTTQILIGDGTGFTAAALSGDVTMTNAGVVSLAANSVDSDQYVDGSIDNAHIADDAIDSEHYAAGSIDTAHIADTQVTLAKIANQAANTVLVRDANSSGVVSAKALTTTQILIGDGTGFTAAALSGDATMTNAGVVSIADDVISSAELADACAAVTSFTAPLIEGSTSVQTPLIEYTDGDDAIAIADGGLCTFPQLTTFSKATKPALKANTDGTTVTFDVNEANMHTVTLGGNRAFAISNETAGQRFIIRILQDGTGSRTVTWFSTIKWAGGSAPTLTTTASKADVVGFIVTGADTYDGFVVGQNV